MSAKKRFLDEFSKAALDDAAAIFVGAGVSAGAGYPSWKGLLEDIADELGVKSNDVSDLAALAQWSIRKSAGKTRVLSVIREKIGVDKPVPIPLEVVARLPIRNIWTTNYDRLIERAFEAAGRPIDTVSDGADLAIRARPGAARLFKMHGTVDRLNDLVISTDDYELYRQKRGAFLPMLQAHMTSFSMLFIGLSLADPNLRHVLSMIRESFSASPPEHFAIVRPPHAEEFATAEEFEARLTQHRLWADDLLRYGLLVVEIDSYAEVPELMIALERRIASKRVWISGSWPEGHHEAGRIARLSRELGAALGGEGFALISGSGLTVSASAIDGFIGSLRREGVWDLDRRLIVRPFAQPARGQPPDAAQWKALRAEMARLAGVVIFVGGAKITDGALAPAAGVEEERALATAAGAYLLPLGSTGGQAEAIARELIGSDLPHSGIAAARPSDAQLQHLLSARDAEVVAMVVRLLRELRA